MGEPSILERADSIIQGAYDKKQITQLNYEIYKLLKKDNLFLDDIAVKLNFSTNQYTKAIISESRRKIREVIAQSLKRKKNHSDFERYIIQRINEVQNHYGISRGKSHDRDEDALIQVTDGTREALESYASLMRIMEERDF